ncbi:MAG: M20 family metallopeptidase [Acidimicrobiales bacterium]
MDDLEAVKARMAGAIDERTDRLLEVSHEIHAHPELNFEEHFAHDLLCDTLAAEGIATERHAYGLDTAFVARAGERGADIAICLEYDALPGLGHACGHNIIAAAGLGAGIAAATMADECGGRVSILGTPAEEGGGGKVFMVRAGAFDHIDAAVMVHPADAELCSMDTLAVQQCIATYTGAAAHAAAAPERGRNALDAAVLGYVNVAALRQHIEPAERIHGVFTDGGDKPNIVPARAETHWFIRSSTATGLQLLIDRVTACLEAGAMAAGCEVDLTWVDPPFADMVDIDSLLAVYTDNAARLGRDVCRPDDQTCVSGSTDMGDVSYVVPSIHPMIKAADAGISIHTAEFARFARGPSGDRAVIDGAKAMAWTVADLWLRPGVLDAARDEFARKRQR